MHTHIYASTQFCLWTLVYDLFILPQWLSYNSFIIILFLPFLLMLKEYIAFEWFLNPLDLFLLLGRSDFYSSSNSPLIMSVNCQQFESLSTNAWISSQEATYLCLKSSADSLVLICQENSGCDSHAFSTGTRGLSTLELRYTFQRIFIEYWILCTRNDFVLYNLQGN